ncbi:MAG: elongation factor P, partial [Clostridia bacterium]|nr:elongation factor P [Clostridia bacterium]
MGYIMAGDFRKGVTFKYESKVVTVVEFLHVKPGKGAAFVRTKLRDVINGGVVELTFNPTAKFETAEIVYKKM